MKLPFENLQNIKYRCTSKLLFLENKMLEYSSVNDLTYNNDKNIKLDVYAKSTHSHNSNEGIGRIKLTALQFSPLTIENTINNAISDDMGKGSASIKLYYGDKGGTLSFDSAYASDLSTVDINAKATTTMEKLKNIDLHLSHKVFEINFKNISRI